MITEFSRVDWQLDTCFPFGIQERHVIFKTISFMTTAIYYKFDFSFLFLFWWWLKGNSTWKSECNFNISLYFHHLSTTSIQFTNICQYLSSDSMMGIFCLRVIIKQKKILQRTLLPQQAKLYSQLPCSTHCIHITWEYIPLFLEKLRYNSSDGNKIYFRMYFVTKILRYS